jgi:hypothetical protein
MRHAQAEINAAKRKLKLHFSRDPENQLEEDEIKRLRDLIERAENYLFDESIDAMKYGDGRD